MERDLVREDIAHASPIWVIKIGTSVLAAPDGTLDEGRVARLTDQIAAVLDAGKRVALVSSGAVGAGIGRLGLSRRPTDLRTLQAAAAAGQAYLIRAYDDAFRAHGRNTAQLLLTRSDFDDRSRYLNVRNTLLTLFEYRTVPIINENDTVSVEEIRFGDNDYLAAQVTNLLCAPLLLILSVVDGVLSSGSPSGEDPPEPIRVIRDIDEAISRHVSSSRSALGSGGMKSKLEAARLVTRAGGSVIIGSGRREDTIRQVLEGRPVGTLIPPLGATQQARRRWIGSTARPRGWLVVDDGARIALETGRGSLLAIGMVEVYGKFSKGDVVGIRDRGGEEFARGLSNYSGDDARKIRGLRTDQIASSLGIAPYDEVIHRDNLVVVSG
ncbi:glutamate 5-kinase [Tautonia plasticadhaerens]|uniref:Glutamate 5-kinase n=1 Tax=Tautonia plasticadhaerens TaxID=2527974 RepID=A0A518H8J2_9BACT|nr:glutamate 5-kinase [Tautonia plasticadhaerens]QDV37160.1 Glutamate 5-kinase [Tautonia plasticadhaerens]